MSSTPVCRQRVAPELHRRGEGDGLDDSVVGPVFGMPRAKSVGVVLAGSNDGVGELVLRGIRGAGVRAEALRVDMPWPSLEGLDELVVPGPMFDLALLSRQLQRSAAHLPPISIWLTEQTPSPQDPGPAQVVGLAIASAVVSMRTRIESDTTLVHPIRTLGTRGMRWQIAAYARHLHRIGRLVLLATQTPSHATYFHQRLGIPTRVVPYGYDLSLGRDLRRVRDVDVVFLGSLRDRRRRPIVEELMAACTSMGLSFRIIDGEHYGPLVFGEERTELLNRAKILLSIMRQPWDDMVFRMLLAAPNGALLVSEPVVDSFPFESGVHFVMAPINELPTVIKIMCAADDCRQKIVDTARERVVGQMDMTEMSRRFIANVME